MRFECHSTVKCLPLNNTSPILCYCQLVSRFEDPPPLAPAAPPPPPLPPPSRAPRRSAWPQTRGNVKQLQKALDGGGNAAVGVSFMFKIHHLFEPAVAVSMLQELKNAAAKQAAAGAPPPPRFNRNPSMSSFGFTGLPQSNSMPLLRSADRPQPSAHAAAAAPAAYQSLASPAAVTAVAAGVSVVTLKRSNGAKLGFGLRNAQPGGGSSCARWTPKASLPEG